MLMTYLLKRVAMTAVGVFGVLIDENNIPFVLTMERPWLNNQEGISCIPWGDYDCVRINSPKHGNCFQVLHVPNRTNVEIHIGNTEDDSEGCILIGENFAYNIKNGHPGVAASGTGFAEFMGKLAAVNAFTLKIREV